ncbi:MAG: hypothetical protein EP347_08895 [Alphaproteobacteria bacterium]|nr:MAG: hypothetical protein EP347_08895 [Alphaproteobacteria bacterium]
MTAFYPLKKALAMCLAGQLILASSLCTAAQAEMVTTQNVLKKYAATMDRAFLMDELQREEVRKQLIALGVDPMEAEARLAVLSDAEIASLVAQYKEDAAGGNGVVGAMLTVFIILLVTDLLCMTKVFSFTRCVN